MIDIEFRRKPVDFEERFSALVEQWRDDTLILSSVAKRVMHPAYQRIIGMGPAVIPLILGELERRPDHWFWALTYLTDDAPAESINNFNEASLAWLAWGRERGLIN